MSARAATAMAAAVLASSLALAMAHAAVQHPVLARMAAEVAQGGEPVQVFKVENPLSRQRFGDLLGNLDLYHTGLLVYDRKASRNYTFEFTAETFGAFFPAVDAQGNMHWNDFGFVQPVHGWTPADWERVQYMGDVSADGFADYMKFVEEFNRTHTEYELFQLTGPGQFVQSHTCYDFVFESLQYLYAHPSSKFTLSSIWRDDVTLHASSIDPADTTDPAQHAKVSAFYKALGNIPNLRNLNMTSQLVSAVGEVLHSVGGQAYIRVNGTMYAGFEPARPYLTVGYSEHSIAA
mmetsp:Transcript_175871/g.427792  ORF Transcript_175871/g.427792 Transcript_175871/m.427792 type:complete len:292 (-) Transcript_175871:46-921(-)